MKTNPIDYRKLIHFLTGLAILFLTFTIERQLLLWLIVAGTLFAFLSYNISRFGLLHKSRSGSLGTLFYPAGVLSAYLILYNQPMYFFQTALLVLTVSDTAANLTGQIRKGNQDFKVLSEKKSLYGVLAFSMVSLLVFYAFLPEHLTGDIWFILLALLLAVNFEVISYKGSDNFSITFGLSLFFFISAHNELNTNFLLFLFALMAVGAYLMFYWKTLSRLGSLAAYLLGVFFVGVMGLPWVLLALAFFISSLLFTKLNRFVNNKSKAGTTRNAWQVFANILWAVVAAIAYVASGNPLFVHFFIVLIAAVTADTWASELGPLLNRKSLSLKDWRHYPAGTTGAVSLGGTLAALAGAFGIVFLASKLFGLELEFYKQIMLAVAAFASTFIDSILGAWWEPKLLRHRFFTQRTGTETLSPNDLVNLSGSLSAIGLLLLFSFLF